MGDRYEEMGWQPIETAPKDGRTWVELRMPRATAEPGWWVATVVLDEDEDNDGYVVSIKHYNGTNLVGIFYPSLRAEWRPLPAPPPDTGRDTLTPRDTGGGDG